MDFLILQNVNPSEIQTLALLFTAGSAFAAFLAALFNYRAIKTHLDNEKSKVLLQCLEKYFNVRKDRTRAIQERRKELCEDYYREILDLLWTEFILWKKGYIDDEIMIQWSLARTRHYTSESMTYLEKNEEREISCKDYWNYVTNQTNYFEITDPFVIFMNQVHSNNIEQTIKIYSPHKSSWITRLLKK